MYYYHVVVFDNNDVVAVGGGGVTGKLAAAIESTAAEVAGCMNELPRAIHKLPGTERARAQPAATAALPGLRRPEG